MVSPDTSPALRGSERHPKPLRCDFQDHQLQRDERLCLHQHHINSSPELVHLAIAQRFRSRRNCGMVSGGLHLSDRDGHANSIGVWSVSSCEGCRSHRRAHSRLVRDDSMCIGRQILGPLLHESSAPLEEVAPGVSRLRRIAQVVGQGGFPHHPGCVGALDGPVLEAAAEPVGHPRYAKTPQAIVDLTVHMVVRPVNTSWLSIACGTKGKWESTATTMVRRTPVQP